MVVHMRLFSSDRSSRCIPHLTLRLFVCSLARFVDSNISAPHLEAAFATQVSVCLFIWWCIGRIAFAGYPKRKNILPIYVFRVFLFLTQLRPASSEDCQHVLWSAVFSSRTWTYVTWSLGRRSDCVWAYSRWLGRLSWVEWEEGVRRVGGGWFCSVFAQLCLVLFLEAQIEPVHNKLAKNKAKQKQTIVTFCDQNIFDLQLSNRKRFPCLHSLI